MARGRNVFLCYRREDTAGITGRLKDRLDSSGFTAFMDTEDISSGTDWTVALRQAVTSSDVLVAVIGPTWLTCHDQHGRRRLDNPTDHVVDEIATALDYRVRAIPVLIDGTPMPAASVLPPRLTQLSNLQALPLRHNSFVMDAERLMNQIDPSWRAGVGPANPVSPPASGGPRTTASTPAPAGKPRSPVRAKVGLGNLPPTKIIIGFLALALTIVIAVVIARLTGPPRLDQRALSTHVPAPIRSQCQSFTPPQDPLQAHLRVALTCHPEGDAVPQEINYLHYDSLDAATAAYRSQLPDKITDSDCHSAAGQQAYTRPAAADDRIRRGNLACFQSSDYTITLIWTDETLDVVAMARFPNGARYGDCWTYWRDYAGPV
jgi:hypothetical protein